MKILFVCQANVARSQMAEAYYNHFTNSKDAISAGVLDFTPAKYGHPIKEVIQIMKEDGLDVSKQKVEFLTEQMVKDSDKVFVMCAEKECPEFLLKSGKVTFWDVTDPFEKPIEGFRECRDIIKNKVKKLVEK
ncbi:MAG: arsenate reductase ArsC [Parcubacteria group bacterium]|nr:arsenate reductase ArsC [Parcubacteria group bacterium]